MFTVLLATAAALTGLVSAQNSSDTWFTQPIQINPGSEPLDLRMSWCTGQKNNCWRICGGADASLGSAYPNQCDPDTLTYTCTCTNGNQPNISNYMDTLPYYVCSAWRDQCTAAHPNDLSGQTACQSVTCGQLNASAAQNNAAGGSSGSSASASGSASPSATASSTSGGGSSGSASASASGASSSSSGNAAVAVGTNYGTGILMGGLLAVFGLAL